MANFRQHDQIDMITMNSVPKVYILILNYRGCDDTPECLESVLRIDYPNYQIILVDNASPDDSIEKIRLWAAGEPKLWPQKSQMPPFKSSPIIKPIPLLEYDRAVAESGGGAENGQISAVACSFNRPIILIHSGGNLGFAGGNNIALRYALKKNDFKYVWLLNNDTVVEPSSLTAMVARLNAHPAAGICGSTQLYYDQPELIQARGGAIYNRWFATSRHIGVFESAANDFDLNKIERKMAYVCGSSMLVSKAFLDEVGLMSEDYFLYYEELDWVTRARGKFAMVYAPESIIYHKEGLSIGSSSHGVKRKKMADFYGQRNRIIFTRKFFPWALPLVYLSFLPVIMNRIIRKQWDRVPMMLKILLHPNRRYDEND